MYENKCLFSPFYPRCNWNWQVNHRVKRLHSWMQWRYSRSFPHWRWNTHEESKHFTFIISDNRRRLDYTNWIIEQFTNEELFNVHRFGIGIRQIYLTFPVPCTCAHIHSIKMNIWWMCSFSAFWIYFTCTLHVSVCVLVKIPRWFCVNIYHSRRHSLQ